MDPFSAATGGAGLVSLGITICNGLLTYCSNYRSRREDLAVLSQRTEELKEFVRLLEERQKSSTGTKDDIKSSLQECCNASTLCLQEIDIFNGKFVDPPPNSSLKEQGTSVARKLQFPFQKDRFESFRRQIHELHVALSGQILLLNSDLTNDLHRLTLSESKTIQAAICDEGNRLSSQISSITPDIQRTLDDSFSKIGKPLECQLDNLEKLIVTSLQSLRNEEAQGPRGKDFSEEPAIRLERQRSAAKISRLVQGQTLFGIQCHCSPCNPGSHQASCFYSVRSLKKAKFTGQIIFFNLMFRWKIEAQYSPRAFPRDFRVYPNFTIRAVNQNSPAWQILGETFLPHIYCPSHLWKVVGPLRERCYRGLRLLHQCFAEEKAWPTDVNDSGLTIFHDLSNYFTFADHTDDDLVVLLQFIKVLVELGMPINDHNESGQTPFVMAVLSSRPAPWTSGELFLFKALIELGAEPAMSERNPCSGLGGLKLLPYEVRAAIGIDIPFEYKPLSRAVLEMSESRIQELLSESREYLLETAVSGETPLHLAVSWAGGLRLLLQALDKDKLQTVLEAEDCRGHTALDYALLLEQVDSIRLLIDAGAFIDLENTQNIQTGLPRSLLPFRPGSKGNLMRLLCRILTERRERLAAIAFRWLPSDSLASFNLTAQQMPQEQAFDIVAALKPHAFSEHWPYEARPGSVYHTRCMSTDRAKALYEAGFDRTDVSFHGFTPLMTVDFYHIDVLGGFSEVLDLTNWFVGHGADIDKIIPSDSYPFSFLQKPRSSNFRVVHRCAYWLGDCWPHYHDFMELQKEVPSESIALLMQISERSERDACECFCTGHGCSPLSLLTRGLLKDWEGEPNLFSYGQRYQELFLLTDLLSRGQVASQDVVRDVLRIIAFTELGMSHTCCVHDIDLPPDYNVGQAILDGEFSPIHLIDPDEAREIQEEDRYTAAWLDKFMVEVGEKLAESDQPYKEFFTGYFRTRLRKVLRKKEHLSPEDMRNIRDIGVVLDSESESDSDLWSGSDSDSEMQMN